MKILIIGFQRSGTTLLRRIIHVHPEVRKIFHEDFLLKRYNSKDFLYKYLIRCGVSPDEDNWGEKVPFYPSARGMSIIKYWGIWNSYFKKYGRIIHIVRHPIDVAFSIDKKYRGQTFGKALGIYKRRMPAIISKSLDGKMFIIKYEEMLIDPEKVIPRIYKFCGIDPNVDFKTLLSKIANPKYQKIDPTRVFAYKKKQYKIKVDLQSTVDLLNKIKGPEYKL